MSKLLKEIITVEDFRKYQPAKASQYENEQIQDCINSSLNDLYAFTNFLIEKVFIANTKEPPVPSTDPLYRNEEEMSSLYFACLSQTYFKINMGNDNSIGDASYNGAGTSISQSFSERNMIGNDVYQHLINARLIKINSNEIKEEKTYNLVSDIFGNPIKTLGEKPYPDPVYVPSKFDNYIPGSILTINQSGYVIQGDGSGASKKVYFSDILGEPLSNELLSKEFSLKTNVSDFEILEKNVVQTNGDQTINGTKTFNSNIKVPNGVSSNDAVNFSQIADFIKYTNLDTRAFTQVGGLVSLKLKPSSNLLLQSDGLGVDMTKVAYSQPGALQTIGASWNLEGDYNFRVKLPTANEKISGSPILPTTDGQLVVKKYVDINFAKKDWSNLSQLDKSILVVDAFNNSLNKNQSEITIRSDADKGNLYAVLGARKPVRSGTITVSNKFEGTSTTQIGNRWYANWKQEIPELNESYKDVVLFLTPSSIPPYVVANNQDQNGYAVRFDNPTYSNTDSTITLGIGENLLKIEGKLDSPIRGYYQRTSNIYQLVQFGMYLELSDDGTHLDIYGQCSGRDRQIYLNLPGDEGQNDFAPQNYQISYAVYERERRVN